jgi:hypothetical protein
MTTGTNPETIIAAATRLYAKHGAQVGAWHARQFGKWYTRGSERRQFWRSVSESILDANPTEA